MQAHASQDLIHRSTMHRSNRYDNGQLVFGFGFVLLGVVSVFSLLVSRGILVPSSAAPFTYAWEAAFAAGPILMVIGHHMMRLAKKPLNASVNDQAQSLRARVSAWLDGSFDDTTLLQGGCFFILWGLWGSMSFLSAFSVSFGIYTLMYLLLIKLGKN